MAVTCSHCGEELMGAVNRCWKCGQAFALKPERDGRPPLRRPPVLEPAGVEAEVIVAESAGDETPTGVRRGSPFVADSQLTSAPRSAAAVVSSSSPAATPVIAGPNYSDRYAEHVVSIVAAVVSVVLGVASLGISGYFPIGAVAVAVVGLAMGVWGLYSDRRGVAVIGLILCCIALSIGGYRAVVQVYTSVYDVSPWQREDEMAPLDPAMDEGMEP